jgi:bleomycin hydrolase
MNKLLNNALMATESIEDILVDQNKIKQLVNQGKHFTHELEDLPDISDQKKSGRCWMFAGLYYYRTSMIRKYKLDSKFDFSTSWLFFHDKLEKFRHGLMLLKHDPEIRGANSHTSLEYNEYIYLGDGGHIDNLHNLLDKYGVVPKEAYGESNNTEKTQELNGLLKRLFRVYAYKMKTVHANDKLEMLVQNGVVECRKLLEYCLGVPPTRITWQYRGKDDNARSREVRHDSAPFKRRYFEKTEHTPLEFWALVQGSVKYQQPTLALVNDPLREPGIHAAGIRQVCNVYECMGKRTYLTSSMDVMLEYAKKLVRAGQPVVFSCGVDLDCYYNKKCGVMDRKLFQYEELCPSLSGFDELRDRVSSKLEGTNHVMCIVGFNVLDKTWKIANSWGTDCGYAGYWIATTDWFYDRLCKFLIPIAMLSDGDRTVADAPTTIQYGLDDPVN